MTRKNKYVIASLIIAAVIITDQVIKLRVKTSMTIGESIQITDWFYLLFVENKGMAFGMDFIGTMCLTLLRLAAVAFFVYFLGRVIREHRPFGFIACLSLVIAGAFGNVIDNCFYGMIFSQSNPFEPADLVSFGKGDGTFLTGHVVDMFYFPIIRTTFPDWLPIVGGSPFVFFSPIFNFADAAISCGAIAILLFYRNLIFIKNDEEVNKGELSKNE